MHDIILIAAGMLIIIMAIPIAQTTADTVTMLLGIVVTFAEWAQSIFNLKTINNNVKIQNLKDSIGTNEVNAIGFQAPNEYSEFDDDEEEPDEDKLHNKNKMKVGF